MFQRGLVRAGIDAAHSQGFNPRPKISLPLPRTVGVASCEDMLCVVPTEIYSQEDMEGIRGRLSDVMPAGCNIRSVELRRGKFSRQARSCEYVFPIGELAGDKAFQDKVAWLEGVVNAGEELIVERWAGKDKKKRKKDISGFIEAVGIEAGNVVLKSRISGAGSIRVDEVMELLGIDQQQMVGPVVRRSVEWS